jgi:hypothetical protein
MTEKLQITEHLKKLRGQNIAELSRTTGIPKGLLHDWISARRIPSLKNVGYLKLLAEHIGITLDELLVGKCEKENIVTLSFKDNGNTYNLAVWKKE